MGRLKSKQASDLEIECLNSAENNENEEMTADLVLNTQQMTLEPEKRKTRKEKRKEKLAKNAQDAENAEAAEAAKAKPFAAKSGLQNSRMIFSYASGQPLGPEGTNPADAIAVTGNLLSPPNTLDVQIEKLSVSAFGKLLIKDSNLNLINGRRYGLIAPNGSGKSTLLHAIACGLLPLPEALDFYLLDREYVASDLTCIEAVYQINQQEVVYLENEMDELLDDMETNQERLDMIQTRLAELDVDNAEHKIRRILKGLSFKEDMINQKTKNLSGGWRMRIALARILFIKPSLMMLDEPTNHLDLEAVAWLEEYLVNDLKGHTLLITCHTQDTLNEICTDIIHLHHQKLDYYSGNYNTFLKIRAEKDTLLSKHAKKMEKEMQKLQSKLNMTGSEQQKQAKSKVKAIEKRSEKNTNPVLEENFRVDKQLIIRFRDSGGGIPSPAIKFQDVRFGYSSDKILFEKLNFGLDLKSRVALVGPNGAGKTTLFKLLLGQVDPLDGTVSKHHSLRIALFHQHMADQLDMEVSAVEWLQRIFKEKSSGEIRNLIGQYGLTGKSHVIPIKKLSDGQRRRIIFCYLGLRQPHILLMDEPTNALDISTIDALADAINNFDGGVILISHDIRLIEQVAQEIWIVGRKSVTPIEGDIRNYKKSLKEKIAAEREAERKESLLFEIAMNEQKPIIGL